MLKIFQKLLNVQDRIRTCKLEFFKNACCMIIREVRVAITGHRVVSLPITFYFTRGPCESGLLFAYNHTSDATQCLCNKNLVNFYPETGQCFQFDTKGPCRKGQMFQYSKMIGRGECLCRKGKVPNFECHFTWFFAYLHFQERVLKRLFIQS